MTGLTALGALRGMTPARRTIAAAMVAIPYLAASYYAQAAFKETAEALLVLAFTIWLTQFEARREAGARAPAVRPPTPGVGRRDLLRLLVRRHRLAGRDPRTLEPDPAGGAPGAAAAGPAALPPAPATLLAIAVLAGLAVLVTVGPFGFAGSFNKVAGSNTYGPVSPLEALGIWPASNYRLDAVGGARLPGLAGTIAILALLAGIAWWTRRRELTIPIALGAGALLYLISLPSAGDYSQAKALMIIAPLAMLVAVRPLLEEFPRLGHRGRGSAGPSPQLSAGPPPPVPRVRPLTASPGPSSRSPSSAAPSTPAS